MRNYIYISNAKLDVLLPQIQRSLASRTDKASVAFKLDLKVLSSEIQFGEAPPDVYRTKLLERLTEHILENNFCGSVTDEGEYIHDILQANLYQYAEGSWGTGSPALNKGQICFGGRCAGGAFAFLGSQHHIIGAIRAVDAYLPGSLQWFPDTDKYPRLYDLCNESGGMRMEVLALRHKTHQFKINGHPTRFVVGSPIYVALV